MMRRTLIISALAVIALVVVAIAILTSTVDRFRPRIQSELQQKLNRQVTLGHIGLRILPLSVKIESFSIGEDPAFSTGKPFAQAQQVFLRVGLFSLLTGNPTVKKLVLDKPEIELVKNRRGVWNVSTLGTDKNKANNSDQVSLNDLEINDGKIGLTDQLGGASATGSLSTNVHVQGPAGNSSKLSFTGNGTISGFSLRTPALAKPLTVKSASMRFDQDSASISSLNAGIGSTNVHGNLAAKNFSAPQLQFALTADNIDVAELEAPASNTAQAKSPSPNNEKQPSLVDELTGSGTLAAARIKSENIVLTNVHTTCKLNHGVIQLSPLTADLFGGKQEGALTLDVRPAKPLCSVHSKLSGVDSNALLSAVSSLRDTLYGTLNATTALAFTLGPSADLAKSLNGNLEFQIANGQLKNVNILNEIAKVGKFLNSAPAQSGSGTALRKLSGTLLIKNGIASTNNLAAVLDAGSLAANGQLSLVDQSLNMHVNAVLGSQVSQTVGGSRVGGYLNTALSNSNGELVIPVNITGTTSHPVVTPDTRALAQMKLKNLLPTSGDPGKLTSGVVGAISGQKGAGGVLNQVLGGQQTQKPNDQGKQDQNPVNSILNQLGKKPQK
ncbi:MAG TPA: AsmA family protein [Chthoniobacterales bacterium]|nr:AsmA family protein [Chthoniobacterales bacterium]